MLRSLKIIVAIFLFFNLGCSTDSPEDSTPSPNPTENPGSSENPNIDDNLLEVTGTVDLGDNLEGGNLNIIGLAGDYDVNDTGEYIAGVVHRDKKLLFVENNTGELLYAAFVDGESQDINAETTAKVMFGMMPWTANTSFSDLSKILDEVKEKEQFKALVEAIEVVSKNNQPPLADETVQSSFKSLLSSFSANNQSIMRIPEVDYLVEPKIDYPNNTFRINNDGTTTAAWGVEIVEYESRDELTGTLVIPGNKVSFPSLSSLFGFLTQDLNAIDMVFQSNEPLIMPLSIENKYEINFGSPTSSDLFSSELSMEAARYNIYQFLEMVLKSMGLDTDLTATIEKMLEVKGSDLVDLGCVNDVFDSNVNSIVNLMSEEDFDAKLLFTESIALLHGNAESISECAKIFENAEGIEPSKKMKFLRSALKFFDVYAKLELVYTSSKLLGDMLLLNDISICRQVLNGEIYPCFKLVENPDIDDKVLAKDEEFKIDVSTELIITPEEETFPVGAKIHWEVIEGDGTLNSEITNVNSDGIAEVTFIAGKEEKQIILASIKKENGEIIEEVEYNIEVSPYNYKIQIGNYFPDYSLIEPQQTLSPGDDFTTPNYMVRMVRLTLDDEPVLTGDLSLPWTQFTFGNIPSSGEDFRIDNYPVELYDATNHRYVSINLNVNFTNKAFRTIVDKSFKVKMYSNGEPTGSEVVIEIDADGTMKYFQYDEWRSIGYSWYPLITPRTQNCGDYSISKEPIGAINFSGITLPGMILKWIIVYSDDTLSPNSHYQCLERYTAAKIE
jgi:hypothetical protein